MSAKLRDDYWVPSQRQDDLAWVALEWRRAAGNADHANFCITKFVTDVLAKQFTRKGDLRIIFFSAGPRAKPAYVTYNPLTLHIDTEIWDLAKIGEPYARHIVAHEIGHIILHDYYHRGFSNDPKVQINFDSQENSAEWQANIFADCFLLPDHIVKSFADIYLSSIECAVPIETAEERYRKVLSPKKRMPSGEVCKQCNNFTVVLVGLRQECESCGARGLIL